jgi:uncharacterized protein YhbP (UPF0306 family)
MDNRIVRFLKKHHVLTLATCREGVPWCASMFYAFMGGEHTDFPADPTLVFTSDPATRHITEALQNQEVAGAIALETEIIGLIRGIQFSGILIEPINSDLKKRALKAYFKRFPYAILNNSPLWVVKLHEIKFTDNRLGFGKKLLWRSQTTV